MAISTGDICTDAMDAIQTATEAQEPTTMYLDNLCFIFKKKYELDSADIRTDFQDIYDWFSTQSWVSDSSMRVIADWVDQTILITRLADPPLPSSFYSSG